ncbi:uncharacterized protein Z518_03864 [Rhinocladiella mackenziei CBS 650.93]|uniref:Uncharacterized protein n=1 Tax=Rhinocladiella mackenziei CBS 650.93 TaxID=1442369 RepID=A0A0D2IRX5_9EURO|nr:uncharacterized protein Z518_03864 [Rhinocladiella mackenziei CBS 650.93]KIX05891.1 hypothetical protein Z518_03864 [Rhinocladiella mackenziei CBS 650.93]
MEQPQLNDWSPTINGVQRLLFSALVWGRSTPIIIMAKGSENHTSPLVESRMLIPGHCNVDIHLLTSLLKESEHKRPGVRNYTNYGSERCCDSTTRKMRGQDSTTLAQSDKFSGIPEIVITDYDEGLVVSDDTNLHGAVGSNGGLVRQKYRGWST